MHLIMGVEWGMEGEGTERERKKERNVSRETERDTDRWTGLST